MNTYFAITCLLALAAAARAMPPATLSYVPVATVDSIPNPNYGFHYAVNDPATGDNKAQWETRNGDVVRGSYSLVEPDGNVRVVEYFADDVHGFNAVVKRTSPNIHSVAVAAPITPMITKAIAAPVVPITEYVAPVAPIAEVAPIAHAPVIAPIYEPAPIVAPINAWDYLPIHAPEPWVHLSGSSYGGKGNIVRRWAAGPISLDGKTLTIRTKRGH